MHHRTELSLPALPAGYTAAAAWGFHDAEGLAYEFFRVYGTVEGTGDRGSFCQLDEDLSYWAKHVVWRCLNYERARSLTATSLGFHRFSSPLAMREEIPRLLNVRVATTEA